MTDGVITRNPDEESPVGIFNAGLRKTINSNPSGRKTGF